MVQSRTEALKRDNDATNTESRVELLSTRLNSLLFLPFANNCKHNSRAEFESIRKDLTLVNIGQLIIAIIKLFENFLLLII